MLSWGKGGRELVRYYGYEWQYPIQIMNTHLFSSNQPISGRFIHRVHTEGGYSQHSRDGHHYHLAGGGTYTVCQHHITITAYFVDFQWKDYYIYILYY